MQDAIVTLIVAVSMGWLGVMGYRFLKPKAGGKACAGGCCDGAQTKPAAAAGSGKQTMMISSDDLRARVSARRK